MSNAQRVIALIVAVITAVMLVESYGAMIDAARDGGRAIPELWPLGTEALALAMEVSVLEAKRLRQKGVLVLSWVLLVASVALSTVLQVAVAPPTLVGWVTAGATPVWLLGSFAVLSLLYRAGLPTPAPTPAPVGERAPSPEAAAPERIGAPLSAPAPSPPGAAASTIDPAHAAVIAELAQSGAGDKKLLPALAERGIEIPRAQVRAELRRLRGAASANGSRP